MDDLHGVGDRPEAIVGAGLDPAPPGDGARARAAVPGLPRRFALYLGRVDPAKGVDALVRAHEAYRRAGGPLGLVLAGRPAGGLRLPGWVVTTGFVDEAHARRPARRRRGGGAAVAAREPVAGRARGLARGPADARHGAVRGARGAERALGRRPALRRRRSATRASSRGSPPTPSCGSCWAPAARGSPPARPGTPARAAGGPCWRGCGARWPERGSAGRDPGLALPGAQRGPGQHEAGEVAGRGDAVEHLARGRPPAVEPGARRHPDASPSRPPAGRSGPSAAPGTRPSRAPPPPARCRRA